MNRKYDRCSDERSAFSKPELAGCQKEQMLDDSGPFLSHLKHRKQEFLCQMLQKENKMWLQQATDVVGPPSKAFKAFKLL